MNRFSSAILWTIICLPLLLPCASRATRRRQCWLILFSGVGGSADVASATGLVKDVGVRRCRKSKYNVAQYVLSPLNITGSVFSMIFTSSHGDQFSM